MQKPQTHPEHVFHFDDAALEDGRTDRRDLDGAAVPGLSAPRSHYISTQSGHNGLLLLHGSPRDEGLSLSDVRLGYHRSGSRVVEFGEDRDHFTCGSRTTRQRSWTFFFPFRFTFPVLQTRIMLSLSPGVYPLRSIFAVTDTCPKLWYHIRAIFSLVPA